MNNKITEQDYASLLDINLISNLVVAIGQVSKITGVPTRKIRYWEEKGYINSEATEGSIRTYNYINIKKIIFIHELLAEGYTLETAVKKMEEHLKNFNDIFKKLSELK